MRIHHYHQDQENEPDLDDDINRPPSKSQRKRDMQALRDMGEELASMPAARLKKIDMPDTLLGALLEWQRLTKLQAKGRQLQYIGKVLRDVDLEPLKEALDIFKGNSAADTARMHRLERLRLRLLEDESVLGEIADEHPEADLQHLRQLRRNALKEAELQKPLRAFREIFQILRDLEDQATAATPALEGDDEDAEEEDE